MTSAFISREETVAAELCSLFRRFGYLPYKMQKFEDYDLYVRFKDYLLSDSVITFTDEGKLLALKPDVTLSLIRSVKEEKGGIHKLFYRESVYRRPRPGEPIRELLQTGLECVGDLDAFGLSEVLLLAGTALVRISEEAVLVLSDLDILGAVLDRVTPDAALKKTLSRLAGEKNLPGVRALGKEYGLPAEELEDFCALLAISGSPEEVLPRLRPIAEKAGASGAFAALSGILSTLKGTPVEKVLRLDFSAVSNGKYYNGLAFRGFVKNLPEQVLSGGQYDNLLTRMGKSSRGVGFAVYLDQIPLLDSADEADADVLLVYGDTDPETVGKKANALRAGGKTVLALPEKPKGGTFHEVITLTEDAK